jgi:hypothetical protein
MFPLTIPLISSFAFRVSVVMSFISSSDLFDVVPKTSVHRVFAEYAE